jgi:4-hydroxy-tetrahydrodipicolinate reductase
MTAHQNPLALAIAGCSGRMGLTLIKAAQTTAGVTLSAGSERPGYDATSVTALLSSAGCPALFISSDADAIAAKATAVIDFTTPEASVVMARAVAKQGGIHIIGTTGFSASEQKEIEACAAKARIVQSGNFSLGVNLLEMLVEQASAMLDDSYDIEISEMHHKHKKDAPSGTALMLGRAAAKGRGVSLDAKKVAARDGITGERKTGDIGFSVQRGGDVVGIHDVMFAGTGEVITLHHQGFSRDIYAKGALKAALWAAAQKPGLYSMRNVLQLRA